ncbi:MAG TPA: DsbA family protein [Gemmatirosa sp.]
MSAQAGAHLRVPVSASDHAQGSADAPVTLVEYGDYECPYCGQAARVVKAVQRTLADAGVPLRFVFRNFPLSEIHPHARHAAVAVESVAARADERAFWAMHDALYAHQRALDDEHLAQYAAAAGADAAAVARDVAADAAGERVDADFAGGVRSGVNGTPTFFVNGARYDGDWTDVDAFAAALARAAGR